MSNQLSMPLMQHPLMPHPLKNWEKEKFKVLGGNSNPELVKKICVELEVEPVEALIGAFSDGETRVEIEEDIRGSHLFIIQSASPPANQNLNLLISADRQNKFADMNRQQTQNHCIHGHCK